MKLFAKQPKVNQLTLYYVLEVLLAVSGVFTHTIYYIYLTTTLGLSNSKAMFLDTILFISVFLFEIPTGIIGDRFGRKFSFIIARAVIGLSLLMYFISGNYTVLIIGSMFFALGMAFQSGAFEAWILDQVPQKKHASIFVNKDIIRKVSIIIIPVISVFIAEKTSYGFPYLISFILSMIAMIIGIVFMKENKDYIDKNLSEKKGLEALQCIGASAIVKIIKTRELRMFIISMFMSSFGAIAINSFSSKLIELVISSKYIGLVIAVSSFVSILFITYLNMKKVLHRTYLFFGFLAVCSLLLIGIVKNAFVFIILFMIMTVMLTAFDIQRQTQINHIIKRNRATILSVFSFAGSVSGIIGTVVFGYIADIFSINFIFSIAGIALLLSIIPLMRSDNKKSV